MVSFEDGPLSLEHLTEHTLRAKLDQLLEDKQLLPVTIKILNTVARLYDRYFSEFELQNQNLLITEPKWDSFKGENDLEMYEIALVNQ